MTQEAKNEKKEVFVDPCKKYEGQADPFGVVRKEIKDSKVVKKDLGFIREYGLEVDKETHRTKPVVKNKINLDKLVQSYKAECGLEYMLRMVQQGRVSPEDICDDGKHGVDATQIPTFAGDALRLLKPRIEEGEKLKETLGIPKDLKLKEENLEAVLKPYIESYFNKMVAAKKAEAAKKEGE